MLYRLRESLGELVEQRPALQARMVSTVGEWLEELGGDRVSSLDEFTGGGGELDGPRKALMLLAVERAWLQEQDGELADDDDAPIPIWRTRRAPLLCSRPARDRRERAPRPPNAGSRPAPTACGRWQIRLSLLESGSPRSSPVRRYAAIPPEQLQHASRWSVFLGALVAIDGTWRNTGTLAPMRPGGGRCCGRARA